MPLLNEYLKLRTEFARELTWRELDDNFLYVANPWSPERAYKVGNIVYDLDPPSTAGPGGYGWWVATADNGPLNSFNPGNWAPIGDVGSIGASITVISGVSTVPGINTLDFDSTNFNVTFSGSTAQINISGSIVKYWLQAGDPDIGTGDNAAAAIHTGNIVIGSGTFPSSYKLAVYGTTNITGDLTVGGTINTVDVLALANDYAAHTHTAVKTSYPNYSILYPNSLSALEDFDINSGTLSNGHTLTWNNTSKKWVNTASTTASLAGLSDVTIAGAANNQILRYNSTLAKWQNVTVVTDGDTGFSTAPLVHNHDTRYYTKTQLQTSGQSSVHWSNLTNKPSDTSYYVVSQAPMGSPFTVPNYRVLTSSDSSILINTGTPNVIDITTSGSGGGGSLDFYQNGGILGAAAEVNFQDSSYGEFNITFTPNTAGNEVSVEFTGLQEYQKDSVSTGTNTSITNFDTPAWAAAGDPNVDITPTYNGISSATDISAVSRIPVYDNGSLAPAAPRQIIDFVDTATVQWTLTDSGVNDKVTIEADVVIPGITPNLQDVTDVGNTTTNDIEIVTPAYTGTGASGGLILTSPSGFRWLITVEDDGNLRTTAL